METRVNDLLLLYHGNTPMGYARVEDISADVKPGWWHLSMLLLKLPPQPISWILREEYIDGQPFTMGGESMRLERLPRVEEATGAEASAEKTPDAGERGKLIMLRPRQDKTPAKGDDIA